MAALSRQAYNPAVTKQTTAVAVDAESVQAVPAQL